MSDSNQKGDGIWLIQTKAVVIRLENLGTNLTDLHVSIPPAMWTVFFFIIIFFIRHVHVDYADKSVN